MEGNTLTQKKKTRAKEVLKHKCRNVVVKMNSLKERDTLLSRNFNLEKLGLSNKILYRSLSRKLKKKKYISNFKLLILHLGKY